MSNETIYVDMDGEVVSLDFVVDNVEQFEREMWDEYSYWSYNEADTICVINENKGY